VSAFSFTVFLLMLFCSCSKRAGASDMQDERHWRSDQISRGNQGTFL